MDFQGRVNSKGSGGLLSSQHANYAKKERLTKLAMETMDLSKDPYFFINYQGTIECKLCTTVHKTEGNYLAHTQGSRHKHNLQRRALREAQKAITSDNSSKSKIKFTKINKKIIKKRKRNIIKIGRPGYKYYKKIVDNKKILIFQVEYPNIESNLQPRHRFMSAFEQKIEKPDKNYQYLLFAADPYETIAFKIPSLKIDKSENQFLTFWDKEKKIFKLQLSFKD